VERAEQSGLESSIFSLEHMEREHITRALAFFNGNRQQASKALGIGRKTLYRKLERYNL
jgi:two-component system NtrC family response regulator